MAVKIVFLGKLADLAGAPAQETVGPLDWAGLLSLLEPAVAEVVEGRKTRIAVNGALLADKSALTVDDGDEVALLPPVSGG